ncbi:fumarylacetoacetase [Pseudogracilibacillus auburnensis]|uniref:fumarylacetoacetase n=1 Tax=Pseudogracilibacillus auburnensis TaxID=1494959 RepID=A0A2V3VNP0_9BACI|nr:fumarylacetoacetase [Pseudogracilibacillus auburnensis]PXW83426.1 fumarylacetoacetate hydrolase [Pseudogracilibacillus auburnensis]
MKRSFIKVSEESLFPIQNLPYGIFTPKNEANPRVGVAIGEYVLDLSVLEDTGFFRRVKDIQEKSVFHQATLNKFMELGKDVWKEVREILQHLLDENVRDLRDDDELRNKAFYPQQEVEMHLPVDIGDYTDFYASKEHATNVGTMFRGKENALMPNWTHLPVGYHGRASSVVLSGTDIHRPKGQIKPKDANTPIFSACRQLDFELETGCFIGPKSKRGEPIPVDEAEDYIFGMVLVNDWSARDIQAWEYVPLGPFLAKNFATSISPWIVSMEALEPFRVEGPTQEPEPLPYLKNKGPDSFDIHLEVYLQGSDMDNREKIATTNFNYMYWSMAQQVAHHTITGCDLNPGDLLASGTISGTERESRGSLMELAWRGADPIKLGNGKERVWLEDGDEVTMTGWCQGEGYRIGFGEVKGQILPAK